MDWSGKKVLVLGLGDTGLSMTRWLLRHGASVRVADTRANPPHGRTFATEMPDVPLTCGGAFTAKIFADVDTVAISPGVDPRVPSLRDAVQRGIPTVGDVEIFAQALVHIARERSTSRPRVLAITGSNGKSTVTAMTGCASTGAGRNTVVAGNIGLPVLDALASVEQGDRLPDVYALELSSFQLESTSSLDPDAATVLNVTEDHLDRYDSMDDYAAAKARIFQGGGIQILNRLDTRSARMARAGREVVTFGTDRPRDERDWGLRDGVLMRGSMSLISAAELPVAGKHNAANALAALALGSAIDLPVPRMLEGLRHFKGLPHRLEKVAEAAGISFYDDSKGTNVGATVAALTGMTTPVVLIAGGDGKGQDFSPLRPAVAAHARAVVLIGRDAPLIEAVLAGGGVDVKHARTMEDAVDCAYDSARAGDAVLLSPACASYDMFRSYVHRGECFVRAVRALVQDQEARRGE
jgi:UDP-N-acetylmuramoylalanine--D-glutamate ligase